MAQANLKVVGIVGGVIFTAAGAELQLHIIVGHNGDLLVHNGQDAGLAHQVPVKRSSSGFTATPVSPIIVSGRVVATGRSPLQSVRG